MMFICVYIFHTYSFRPPRPDFNGENRYNRNPNNQFNNHFNPNFVSNGAFNPNFVPNNRTYPPKKVTVSYLYYILQYLLIDYFI